MNFGRFWTVFSYDFSYNRKRPFYWIWLVLLAWNAWLMSMGAWIIRSIDTAVGTEKSFVNSEFQIAFVFALMPVLLLGLFMAIAAGTPLIRDVQQKIGEILHTTPLRPAEYIVGKFTAAIASSLAVLALFLIILILLNEVIPNPAATDIHGPFRLRNYLMPAVVFFLPVLFFIAGICFALSEFTRKVFLVYVFPVVLLLLTMGFITSWFPPDASEGFTRFMQFIDPTGFRWLKQTWLIVDRGVSFYNTQSIQYDMPFLLSRLFYVLFGIGMVAVSARNFARKHVKIRDKRVTVRVPIGEQALPLEVADLSRLEGQRVPVGMFRQMLNVVRMELKELAGQTWLMVFMVMIAIFLITPDRGGVGPMHIISLYTSGWVATRAMLPLSLMMCFLILFATTESLHRENQTDLSPILYSTPLSTFSLLAGKALVNFIVAFGSMFISFVFVAGLIISSGETPFEVMPFVQTWGLLIFPTFIFWTAFVMAAFSWTKNRMSTYGIALALMFVTGWAIANNKVNWVTNWPLVNTVTWSDFGSFDLDRTAFVLNRLFYLSLSISLFAFAVFRFPRRVADRNQARRKFGWRIVVQLTALLLPPSVLGSVLWIQLEQGFQGRASQNAEKDYWRKNMASFMNEPLPHPTRIEMDIRLEPATREFHVRGLYDLENRKEKPLFRIPLTGVGRWKNLRWSVNGKEYTPENRSGMFVFVPDSPLQTGQTMKIGFSYDGIMLPGISRNGGPLVLGEFILPAGVALTGRNPWFVPVLGFVDSVGIDEKNRYEPEDPGPHFYEGITDAGIDRSLLDTNIRVDVPEEYYATSMGVLTSEKVSNGRRVLTWQSDYPVRVFNVVAGKWTSRNGKVSIVYYHKKHSYNIDLMVLGLDSARRYYSQWFGPYVWKELRISEFPAYGLYARGNPTNIFFSEGIGFLTKDSMDQPAQFGLSAFGVTAHEAAHQWWGHMLSPGEGPGGIVLAEGMAHFATLCLFEQVQGDEVRRIMSKQMEAYYGETRAVSSERPLSKSTFFRDADQTVIYDKGGWVFWMMRNLLGRDPMYAGLTTFIQKWHRGPDHPVLEDFVAHMKTFARDPEAYDHFTQQWFFDVVMPEYRYMEKPQKHRVGNMWEVKAVIKNVGNANMPVDVSTSTGRRFDKEYRESRTKVSLNGGQQREIILQCAFEPDRIVVDPDLQVFHLQRNAATYRFKP